MKNFSLIMGVNCITEVVLNDHDRLIEVLVVKSDNFNDKKKNLLNLLKEKNIPIKHVSKHELVSLVQSDSHQSLVAKVKQRQFHDLKEMVRKSEDQQSSVFLMIDSIYDPHNFGAILRTAECFGVDGVIFSKNRGSDVTPVVAKTSSGASELINLIKVSNLAQSAKFLQDEGFQILAASVDENAKRLEHFSFSEKIVLIMGSEGKGIQPLLEKIADHKVFIHMKGKIDSLNVSQATAVFLYELSKSRPR